MNLDGEKPSRWKERERERERACRKYQSPSERFEDGPDARVYVCITHDEETNNQGRKNARIARNKRVFAI